MTAQTIQSFRADQATVDDQLDGITDLGGAVVAAVRTLPSLECDVLLLRTGLGDGETYTLAECGRIFRLSKERIRQIEKQAVRKLQHPHRARLLARFVTVPSADCSRPFPRWFPVVRPQVVVPLAEVPMRGPSPMHAAIRELLLELQERRTQFAASMTSAGNGDKR